MFAAARVMAAGKAGLESLPYFVDELQAQGITQLAPWAADHSTTQLDELDKMVRERQQGAWREIFSTAPELQIGITLHPDTGPSKGLLREINPMAEENTQLADHPALLAAWSRINIWQYCRDTVRLWRRFKWERGIPDGQQLAVVIPYCPEGPTSGTVGMYLGAALRQQFADARLGDELVVWGIELCPPVDVDGAGKLNALTMRNVFRGYVARQELFRGLPLGDHPEDNSASQPFDITIAFDGGTATVPSGDLTEIHAALDRGAAQTTACLLNGAAGGDVVEGANWLNDGKRWNAHLAHVVSQHTYDRGCRYLNYHVRLPWQRNREEWDAASTARKKNAFLHRIDSEIRPLLESEKDAQVKEKVQGLVELAEKVRAVKWDKSVVKMLTKNDKTVEGYLADAIQASDDWQSEFNQHAPEVPTYRIDPFCINIVLPRKLRYQIAEQIRDHGEPQPIADLLSNGSVEVRWRLEGLFSKVLERRDAPGIKSGGFFEEIIAISIDNAGKGDGNQDFRPARENLAYFIDAPKQSNNGAFNFLTHNLPGPQPEGDAASASLRGGGNLGWQPKDVDFEVPVEFTFVTLSRCRAEDGFKDVSTYPWLQEAYKDRTEGTPSRWQEYAHYYGMRPPAAMLGEAPEHTSETPSVNGSMESTPAKDTNGHRTEPITMEQQV